MDEKVIDARKNVRVPFVTHVSISPKDDSGSQEIESTNTRDISLKGLYCVTSRTLPPATPCEIKIKLTGIKEEYSLRINGRVVRRDSEGMAFEFDEMDIDTFTFLKNLLYYNTGEPEKIDHEILKELKEDEA